MKQLVLVLLMLVPCAALATARPVPNKRAAPSLSTVRRSGEVMARPCTAVAQGRGDSTNTARALDTAWAELALLGDIMSPWQARSELARLNAAAANERFACSSDLYAAIDSALRIAEETGGAFDPTTGPLSRAWDVYGAGRVPAAEELAEARVRVGWRAVARDPANRTVRFTRPGMSLDLGGAARGYALDQAATTLREQGIARALIDLDGEVLAISNREPWQTTVPSPGDRQTPAFRLGLTNATLSTAAQTERGVSVGGVRHGQIIDPATGLPVRGEASVSVVTRSATRATALSGALLVMGRERAAGYVATHPGIGVLWLEPTGEGLHAWAWNLPALEAEPGLNVVWMTPR